MNRHLLVPCAAFALLSATSVAAARTPTEGDLTLHAERVWGFDFTNFDVGDDSETRSSVRLGWSEGHYSPYSLPRFGLDYGLTRELTLGAGLGYFSQEEGADGPILAPRVGYLIEMGSSTAFWIRGGITFYDTDDDDDGFALTGEGYFLIGVADQAGFTVGPTLDFDLGDDDEGADINWAFGVLAGMAIWF